MIHSTLASMVFKLAPLAVISLVVAIFTFGSPSKAQQQGASSANSGQSSSNARRKRVRASNRRRIRRNRARRFQQPEQDWRSQALAGGSP
ncbi:MAG: hypothetical protein AAGD43_11515 [Pseudomonadota bacterium]